MSNSRKHKAKGKFNNGLLDKIPRDLENMFDRSNWDVGEFRARKKNKTVHFGKFITVDQAFNCYKLNKELEFKRVADKWKDQIDPRVYEAMYNYKVEITD